MVSGTRGEKPALCHFSAVAVPTVFDDRIMAEYDSGEIVIDPERAAGSELVSL